MTREGIEIDRIKALSLNFCSGKYDCTVEDEVWCHVFKYIIKNQDSLSFKKDLIHTLWTVNGGHLRRKVADDDLVLSVLLMCLPKYKGSDLVLYRGECNFLYDDKKIGFCWTPKIDVARMFASGLNAMKSGGVLLKAVAPSSAIICSPNEHSTKQMREFEYTCNPKRLEKIEVIEIFS